VVYMKVVKWRLRGCVKIQTTMWLSKNVLFYADLQTVYEIGEKITKIVNIEKALVPFQEHIINEFGFSVKTFVFFDALCPVK
jgi:hypothetical protein